VQHEFLGDDDDDDVFVFLVRFVFVVLAYCDSLASQLFLTCM